MLTRVDPASGVPIYLQLVEQFKRAIASGVLQEGDSLPSLRELARELRINPLTIRKAYEELEMQGIVSTHHGRGTFVNGIGSRLSRSARRDLLRTHVDKLIMEARHLGLTPDEVRDLVDRELQSWDRRTEKE